MDACAKRITGGLVVIEKGDIRWEATGDVTIQPSTTEREAAATAGGVVYVTERAVPATFAMDLLNLPDDRSPMALFDERCDLNITVFEKSRGIRHLFTDASIIGRPEVNLSTGVVSGISGVTDQYSVVA